MVRVDYHGFNPIVFDGFKNSPDSTVLVSRDWNKAKKEAMYKGCSVLDEIGQKVSGQLSALKISQSATGILDRSRILQSPSAKSSAGEKSLRLVDHYSKSQSLTGKLGRLKSQSATGQLEG